MAQTKKEVSDFLTSWPLKSTATREIAFFPSFVHMETAQRAIQSRKLSVSLGAQDCSSEEKGAYTGDVSALMLKELRSKYVLIGHSERRARYETEESLWKKLEQVFRVDLIPVFCIGETREEREAKKVFEVLGLQMKSLKEAKEKFLVAYEPVWAIGTGLTAARIDIQEAHKFIQQQLPRSLGVLYGGSVKPGNTKEILGISEVNGVLVGGASLSVESFKTIVESENSR